MAQLLYGAGLRLSESLELRVKDVDLERRGITVRESKGDKDHGTMVLAALTGPWRIHLKTNRPLRKQDRHPSLPGVALPCALNRKYPRAGEDWAWFWVFPAHSLSRDPRLGLVRRHHATEESVSRPLARAARAVGLGKPVTCHALRHSFATHLLESG